MSPFRLSLTLLFCVLAQGISDASLEKEYEDVCKNVTVSAEDCASDPYGFSPLHSPCNLIEPATTSVTMWQQFTIAYPAVYALTDTTPCMLRVSIQWYRTFDLKRTRHSEDLTKNVKEVENWCELIVNASLTLFDLENEADTDSEYRVVLSVVDCMDLSPVPAGDFSLEVIEPPCINDIPAPVETYLEYTLTESAQCQRINASFIGGKKDAVTTFEWQNSNSETICFSAGVTKIKGRYVCGWTVVDRNMCNITTWLVINNCSSSDAGNYSVFATGRGDGQPAHVLLSFQTLNKDGGASLNAIVSSTVTALVLITIAAVIVVFCVCWSRSRRSVTTIRLHTDDTVQTVIQTTDSSIEIDGVDMAAQQRIWKSMRSPQKELTTNDFLNIAEKITYWQVLARHLGVNEPDIVAIECNYSHDYKEQKIQMLRTWFTQQTSTPTRQTLVRIIEEKMKDPVLAKEVDSVLLLLDLEREPSKPRACTH